MFQNPTVNVDALWNLGVKFACCSFDSIFMFLKQAAASKFQVSNSSHASTFLLYASLLIQHPEQKL
jgi:hypothetical protein